MRSYSNYVSIAETSKHLNTKNNNMKIKTILFVTTLVLLAASCGGDDVDCTDTTTLNATIATATQTLNSAITTWNGSEQTEDQCKTLKSAYEDYIDSIDDVKECLDTLPALISAAQSEVDKLTCS